LAEFEEELRKDPTNTEYGLSELHFKRKVWFLSAMKWKIKDGIFEIKKAE
jgi:hypothetical protein